MKNNYIMTVVVAIIVGGAAFYGGMQYQMTKVPTMGGQFGGRGNAQMGAGGPGGMQGGQRAAMGMTPFAGEIISQDDTSVTVKLTDGSTKIVLISDSTAINKASTGTKTDLTTGEQITVFGAQNQDGSVTAQSVSIGGNMMMRGMGGQAPSSMPAAQ